MIFYAILCAEFSTAIRFLPRRRVSEKFTILQNLLEKSGKCSRPIFSEFRRYESGRLV